MELNGGLRTLIMQVDEQDSVVGHGQAKVQEITEGCSVSALVTEEAYSVVDSMVPLSDVGASLTGGSLAGGVGSLANAVKPLKLDVNGDSEPMCELLEEHAIDLLKFLPKGSSYSYRVESLKEIGRSENYSFHAKFLVNVKTKEEFDSWRQILESETGTQFTILESRVCEGRYVDFKQMLACHHNVRRGKLGVRKHTACPTKMQVTIRSIPLRIRLDRCRVDIFHPCEILLVYNHNHPIWSGDILKHRKVLTDTDEKLIRLFHLGHSPASALECIQMELEDNMGEDDRPECILADRAICPDYPHCTYIYRRHARAQQCLVPGDERLISYAADINASLVEVCVVREECESKSLIAICLPFLKRVHKLIEEASETVFVDCAGGGDGKGNKVYLFMTHSQAGALPLAIGLMPAECGPGALTRLFQLIKAVLPEHSFCSRGRDLGPLLFMTDDCPAEQMALQEVWPLSRLFLSQYHMLQAQWRWLLLSENGIAKRDRAELFDLFKKLIYAQTEAELAMQYAAFSASPLVAKYANFRSNISVLYETRKEKWCSAYRVIFRDANANSYMAASLRVLKDQILHRIRGFNLMQLLHFMTDRFCGYYQRRLMDYASGRGPRTFTKFTPYEGQQISEISSDVFEVASEKNDGRQFTVNLASTMCTCHQGSTRRICKHLHLVHTLTDSCNYDFREHCQLMYLVSCGDAAPSDWLLSLSCSTSAQQLLSTPNDHIQTDDVRANGSQGESTERIEAESCPVDSELQKGMHQLRRKFFVLLKSKMLSAADVNPDEQIDALKAANAALADMSTSGELARALLNFGKCSKNRQNTSKKRKLLSNSTKHNYSKHCKKAKVLPRSRTKASSSR